MTQTWFTWKLSIYKQLYCSQLSVESTGIRTPVNRNEMSRSTLFYEVKWRSTEVKLKRKSHVKWFYRHFGSSQKLKGPCVYYDLESHLSPISIGMCRWHGSFRLRKAPARSLLPLHMRLMLLWPHLSKFNCKKRRLTGRDMIWSAASVSLLTTCRFLCCTRATQVAEMQQHWSLSQTTSVEAPDGSSLAIFCCHYPLYTRYLPQDALHGDTKQKINPA